MITRIFSLIPLLFAPVFLLAHQSTRVPLRHDASHAGTLDYLKTFLENREDVVYLTQSAPDPHAVSSESDSVSNVVADGILLRHDRQRKTGDAQGPLRHASNLLRIEILQPQPSASTQPWSLSP